MSAIGLYIHIPFCRSKCPYCDFYSRTRSEEWFEPYARRVRALLHEWAQRVPAPADTLYLGGGTPSILGGELLGQIIRTAAECFALTDGAEITVECNPSSCTPELFHALREAGVNRLSMGMQSAVGAERRRLGRRSGPETVAQCVEWARTAGIRNLSLDLMMGTPGQTSRSVLESVRLCTRMQIPHVSGYLLKLEEGTPFYARADQLDLPGEDEACAIYHAACRELKRAGLLQYEISNFARPGWESRHNLKYWNGEDYLGIGPAAHSCISGRRFYYPRDLAAFLSGAQPVPDGEGGGFEEYVLLRLRLCSGLSGRAVRARYGHPIPEDMLCRARELEALGLVRCTADGFRLTREGFLLSNRVIAEILYG